MYKNGPYLNHWWLHQSVNLIKPVTSSKSNAVFCQLRQANDGQQRLFRFLCSLIHANFQPSFLLDLLFFFCFNRSSNNVLVQHAKLLWTLSSWQALAQEKTRRCYNRWVYQTHATLLVLDVQDSRRCVGSWRENCATHNKLHLFVRLRNITKPNSSFASLWAPLF